MSGNGIAWTVRVAPHGRSYGSSRGPELLGDGSVSPYGTFWYGAYYIVDLPLEGGEAWLVVKFGRHGCQSESEFASNNAMSNK